MVKIRKDTYRGSSTSRSTDLGAPISDDTSASPTETSPSLSSSRPSRHSRNNIYSSSLATDSADRPTDKESTAARFQAGWSVKDPEILAEKRAKKLAENTETAKARYGQRLTTAQEPRTTTGAKTDRGGPTRDSRGASLWGIVWTSSLWASGNPDLARQARRATKPSCLSRLRRRSGR